MVRAAANFSDEAETEKKCMQLLNWLNNMCNIGLQGLSPDSSNYSDLRHLQSLCLEEKEKIERQRFWLNLFPVLRCILWKDVLDLRKKVEQACSDPVSNFVVFSISSAVKGEIYVNIGSNRIRAPDNLRVNHPLHQMVLFAEHFGGDSLFYLKSMAPEIILRMAETSGSYASPTEYIACWTSANWKSESPNAATNPPCGSKKTLLPVLFDISAMKKTRSTVSVIPQSGVNVKSRPYDSPMTVAEGNCGVSNKSNLELGKAGNRVSFRAESNNCQQHSKLAGGSHVARLQVPMAQEVAYVYSITLEKMPTAAGSVKCGDADESSMLAKQTSPQEQFVLNSSGDGASGNPHSKSALRITPFAGTTFTPMVTDLTEIDLQHLRGLNSAAKNNNQQGASILMINGGGGTRDITIMDSGGAIHASGNIDLFTKLVPEPQGMKVFAANRQQMLDVGYGNIRIPNLGLELQSVYYIPEMGKSKTIVSVSKLNELGYSVTFSQTGCSIRDERTWTHRLIGEARRVNGLFEVDYLRIPLNRSPTVTDGTSTSMWRAAWTRLNSFTKSLVQRHITRNSERLPL